MKKIYLLIFLFLALIVNTFSVSAQCVADVSTTLPPPPIDVCVDFENGQTVSFRSTGSSTGGGVTYTWDVGDTIYTIPNPNHIYENPAQDTCFTVTLTVGGSCGADAVAQLSVCLKRSPDPDFERFDLDMNVDSVVCGLFVDTLQFIPVSSGANFSYNWDMGGTQYPIETPTHSFFGAGNIPVELEIMDNSNGCSSKKIKNVIVEASPNTSFSTSISNNSCFPAACATFTNNTPGNNTYRWYVIQTLTGDTVLQSIDVTPVPFCFPDTGEYRILLEATNTTGCTNPLDEFVTINPTPISNFSIDTDTACADASVTLNFTGTANAGANFSWDFGGANFNPGDDTLSGPIVVDWSPGLPTTKTIVLRVEEDGCVDDSIKTIEILQPIELFIIDIAPNDTVCVGECVTVTSSAPAGIIRYQFFNNGGLVQDSSINFYTNCNFTDGDAVTVVGVDANGCGTFSNDTAFIAVKPAPSITSLTPDQTPICEGESVTYTAVTNPATVDSIEFFEGFVSVQVGASNTYTTSTIATGVPVYAVAYDNGCSGPASDTAFVVVVDSIGRPTVNCGETTDTTIQFIWDTVAGAASYEVSIDTSGTGAFFSPFGPASGNFEHLVDSLTSGDSVLIIVRASGGAPCNDVTFSDTIKCYAIPCFAVDFTTGPDQNECDGDSATVFITNLLPADSTFSITWDMEPPGPDTTYKVEVNGDMVVNVCVREVSLPPTCPNTCKTINITAIPKPTVSVSGAPDSICHGESVTFSASPLGLSNYRFINDDTKTLLQNSANPFLTTTPAAAGTFNVVVVGRDLGCNSDTSAAASVEVIPLPNISLNADKTSICLRDTVMFTATSGYDNYEFVINGTDTIKTTSSIYFSDSLKHLDCIQAFGFNANSCSSNPSNIICMIVNGLPTLNAGPNHRICIGDSTNGFSPTAGLTNYQWTPTNGLNNPNIRRPKASPADTTTYYVTAEGPGGCPNTDSLIVFVDTLPSIQAHTVNFIPVDFDTTCLNVTLDLDAEVSGPGPIDFTWSPGGSGLSSLSIEDPTFTPPSDGNFQFFLDIEDNNGCQNRDSVTLTVHPLPTVDPGNDGAFCEGDSLDIGGSPTGPPGSTYAWSPRAGLNDSTDSNPNAKPTSTTVYTVTVTDTNSCQETGSVTVTVNPLPTVDITGSTTICVVGCTDLTATGANTYTWSTIETTPTITVCPVTDTQFIVIGRDGNGCEDADTVTVTVNELPTIVASENDTICQGDQITLDVTGADSFLWLPDSLTDSSIVVTPQSTTTYIVTGTNTTTNCSNADTVRVVVDSLGTVDAGVDLESCIDEELQLGATAGDANATFEWIMPTDPGITINNNFIASPKVSFIPHGDFTVEVIVRNDVCEESDSLEIFVDRCLICLRAPVPQIITPNQDGTNDNWIIPDIDYFEGNDVKIFNRWGNLVFESQNYNNDWDGKNLNGKDLPDGTYFYILNVSGGFEGQVCDEGPYRGYLLIHR